MYPNTPTLTCSMDPQCYQSNLGAVGTPTLRTSRSWQRSRPSSPVTCTAPWPLSSLLAQHATGASTFSMLALHHDRPTSKIRVSRPCSGFARCSQAANDSSTLCLILNGLLDKGRCPKRPVQTLDNFLNSNSRIKHKRTPKAQSADSHLRLPSAPSSRQLWLLYL